MNETFHLLSNQVNRAFYTVCDGHGGIEAAEMTSQILAKHFVTSLSVQGTDVLEAYRQAIHLTDADVLDRANEENWLAGTTCVSCFIEGEILYVCSVGDSEAIIAKRRDDSVSGNSPYEGIPVSFKHKPSDDAEKQRITEAGALVFRGRIFGKLAVSRALGDAEFKMPKAKADYVICDPHLASYQLDESHAFLIVACDGLWDKVTYQEAVDFVYEQQQTEKSAQQISELLAARAIDKGSKDNVTVIVVELKWRPIV